MDLHIPPSARKHGVCDDDIRHAIAHVLVVAIYDDEVRLLYLGPDPSANLLEVVTVLEESGDELAIHAMSMRPRSQPLLRGVGDADD